MFLEQTKSKYFKLIGASKTDPCGLITLLILYQIINVLFPKKTKMAKYYL